MTEQGQLGANISPVVAGVSSAIGGGACLV